MTLSWSPYREPRFAEYRVERRTAQLATRVVLFGNVVVVLQGGALEEVTITAAGRVVLADDFEGDEGADWDLRAGTRTDGYLVDGTIGFHRSSKAPCTGGQGGGKAAKAGDGTDRRSWGHCIEYQNPWPTRCRAAGGP